MGFYIGANAKFNFQPHIYIIIYFTRYMKFHKILHIRNLGFPIFVLFVASISLTSCKTIIGCSFHDFIKIINLNSRKDRSPEEIEEFLRKRHYRYDYSFLAVDTLLSRYSDEKHNNQIVLANIESVRTKKYSLLQARVFNTDGSYYSSFSQCAGDFESKGFLRNWPPINLVNCQYTNQNLILKNEFDLVNIDTIQTKSVLEEALLFKYIIVVYWNVEANYYSERILERTSRLKRKYPNDVMVILVNNDFNVEDYK